MKYILAIAILTFIACFTYAQETAAAESNDFGFGMALCGTESYNIAQQYCCNGQLQDLAQECNGGCRPVLRYAMAFMSPVKENPRILNETAYGTAIFELMEEASESSTSSSDLFAPLSNSTRWMVRYNLMVYNVTGPIVGTHIHLGMPCENGPIVVNLLAQGSNTLQADSSGTLNGLLTSGSFTDANLTADLSGKSVFDLWLNLIQGKLYVNAHTEQHPSGLIRGQLELNRF